MAEMTEVWIPVPGTDHRYEISNFGHLKKVAKKVRGWNKTIVELDVEIKTPLCSFRDSKIGWLVMLDKKRVFFSRDDLIELFCGVPVRIDTSLDDELKARRDAGYAEWLKKQ